MVAGSIVAPLDREPVGCNGFLVHPFGGIRVAKNGRCERQLPVELALQHLDRIVVAPHEKEPVADDGAGNRVQGVELPGTCRLGDGLVVPPHIVQKGSVISACGRETRVQCERPLVLSLGAGPVPALSQEIAEGGVRIGKALVELECPPRGRFDLRQELMRIQNTVDDETPIIV